jgi:glycine betaine/choline ABC-type transport system substrate-binding protein
MRSEYGLDTPSSSSSRWNPVQALDSGDVDSANVFSTDAQLASGK